MRCLHFSYVDQEHLSTGHVAVVEPLLFFFLALDFQVYPPSVMGLRQLSF